MTNEIERDQEGNPKWVWVKNSHLSSTVYEYQDGFWCRLFRGNRGQPLEVVDYRDDGRVTRYEYRRGLWAGFIGDRRGDMKGRVEGCFLSTACVRYRGLEDNCRELRVLRSFRDRYVRSTSLGEEAIDYYYDVAPRMVRLINNSIVRTEIWNYVSAVVSDAVDLIDSGQPAAALRSYQQLVLHLHKAVAVEGPCLARNRHGIGRVNRDFDFSTRLLGFAQPKNRGV